MLPVPALSIRQPWAWLIVHGHKDVENRSWPTPYRGRFHVHAGKTLTLAYYTETTAALKALGLLPADFPSLEAMRLECGGLVGQACITGCVEESASPWFVDGGYAFTLADAQPCAFVPMAGRLGFFNVNEATA